MKNKIILCTLAMAMLVLAGCKKEEQKEVGTVNFTVVLGSDAKVHLNGLKPNWEADNTDQIKVNSGIGTVTPLASNPTRGTFHVETTDPGGPYCAVYPADIIHNDATVTETPQIDLPRRQKYVVKNGQQQIYAPMCAYNGSRTTQASGSNPGTQSYPVLMFKNLCGIMKITVTNDKRWDMVLDSIHVEAANASLWGTTEANTVQISLSTPQISASNLTNGGKIVSLSGWNNGDYTSIGERIYSTQGTKPTEGLTERYYYVYLPVIPSGSEQFTIRIFSHPLIVNNTDAADSTKYNEDANVHIVYTVPQSSSDSYVGRSEIFQINVSLSEDPQPHFTSMKAFSVSDSKKVCFSRGYVQYNVNSNKWRLAPRQWAFLAQSIPDYHHNSNFDFNDGTNWIEYFGWATGDDPTRCGEALYMVRTDMSSTLSHITELSGNRDWGYNLSYTIGSDAINWETPSKDEYRYVFKFRSSDVMGGHNKKFGWAEIQAGQQFVIDGDAGHSWGTGIGEVLYGVVLIPDGVNPDNFQSEKGGACNTGGHAAIRGFVSNEVQDDETVENNDKFRNDNQYTQEQFEYLEARGCILFPCIGHFRCERPNFLQKNEWDNIFPSSPDRTNPPDARIWSRTLHLVGLTNSNTGWIYYGLFDSGYPGSDIPFNQNTRNVLDASDYANDLHNVKLACPYTSSNGTFTPPPYRWDPDKI